MSKEPQHKIKHQIINLDVNGIDDAQEINQLQQNIHYFYKTKLAEELDKVLTKLCPPDVDVHIDELELDLGDINFKSPRDLERKITKKFKEALTKALREKIKKITRSQSAQTKRTKKTGQQFSKMKIVGFFLENGHMPPWASAKNGSFNKIIDDLLTKEPKQLGRTILQIGKNKNVQKRLFHQLSVKNLEELFKLLYGKFAAAAEKQLKLIVKKQSTQSRKALLSAAINYALSGKPIKGLAQNKNRTFVRDIIEDIQGKGQKSNVDSQTKVRAGFESNRSDIQILEYFLEYGAIPSWGDVGSKQSLQDLFTHLLQHQLVKVQRLVERHAHDTTFIKRLIFQFSTPQILQLLTPTPSNNLQFIQDSLVDFEFLSQTRTNIPRTVSKNQIRSVILSVVLDYFFLQQRNTFVKKTFLKTALEELAQVAQTDYDTLVKESYKSVQRKKTTTAIRPVLEQLDDKVQQRIIEERTQLRKLQKEYKSLERKVKKLLQKQEQNTLSTKEKKELQQLLNQQQKLEKLLVGLEEEDALLEIELLLQQQEELKAQLEFAQAIEHEKLKQRLEQTEAQFKRLQATLKDDVQQLLRDREKLRGKTGSIAEQRIKRVNNNLRKYQRAIKSVQKRFQLDLKELTLMLTDINKALRQPISQEEKVQLRNERKRLQAEYLRIEAYLEILAEQQKELETTLKEVMEVVDTQHDGLVHPDEAPSPSGSTKLEALVFMLQYGATPWWAEDFANQTIESLFLEFAEKQPQKLRAAFQQVGKYPIVWERTINQLSEDSIKKIIASLLPNAVKTIFAQAQVLFTIHYSQSIPHLSKINRKAFQWASILEYLLTSKQSFSPQHFNKEIILQTARLYRVSPKKLLQYTINIVQNAPEEQLDAFIDWSKTLQNDKSILDLDKELIIQLRQQRQQDEGTWLSDDQKLDLVTSFFTTGKIPEKATTSPYNSIDAIEDLLLEQIHKNKAATQRVVLNLLRAPNARALFTKELKATTFWEIVYLIQPKALLTTQRYFEDLQKVFEDDNLYFEKNILLNFILQQTGNNFEPLAYAKSLLISRQQASNRNMIALVQDWKRRTKNRLPNLKSSWFVSLLSLEADVLKHEQQQSQDAEIQQNLQEQLESIATEYTAISQRMNDILLKESIESQSNIKQNFGFEDLEKLTAKAVSELEALQKGLADLGPLQEIEAKRKIAQYEVQIKLLQQMRPPLLRKLEEQIQAAEKALTQLDEQLQKEAAKDIALEAEEVEENYETSIIEQQIFLLEILPKKDMAAVRLLPQVLEQLQGDKQSPNDEQSHYLFIKEVEQIILGLPNSNYRSQLVAIIQNAVPNITALETLEEADALDERQRDLLRQIPQLAPIQLWEAWEALEKHYQDNPTLQTKERQALQRQIYFQIQRKDQKNLLDYTRVLATIRQRLEQELTQADTLETLENVQEQIDLIWKQQEQQVDEIIAAARTEKLKNDFKRFKRNLKHVFIKIQNQRIRKSNAILNAEKNDLENSKDQQTVVLEDLKEKKVILVEDIIQEEKPKEEKEVPVKPKRKKSPPKPKPVVEPLIVFNAGMVLLWPYISRLFAMLKYVKKKEFVSEEAQHKAIHILQYLVTGKTEAPENELILNKILCNYPLTEPIPYGVEFDPEELKIAEGLLFGVIKNWPKMKTMQPNALRGSFLVREGTIKEEPERWLIKVQKKPFDVLLKTVPWGFTFIKLPWLQKFVSVEWQFI